MSNGEINIVTLLVILLVIIIFFLIIYGIKIYKISEFLTDSKSQQEKIIEDIGREGNGSLTYQIERIREELKEIKKSIH